MSIAITGGGIESLQTAKGNLGRQTMHTQILHNITCPSLPQSSTSSPDAHTRRQHQQQACRNS
jgi:hypothetical protein